MALKHNLIEKVCFDLLIDSKPLSSAEQVDFVRLEREEVLHAT